MADKDETPKPKPTPRVTLKSVDAKVEDVLEMTDILQSEISEVKEVLKSLLELQLGLQKEKPTRLPDNNRDSMFG